MSSICESVSLRQKNPRTGGDTVTLTTYYRSFPRLRDNTPKAQFEGTVHKIAVILRPFQSHPTILLLPRLSIFRVPTPASRFWPALEGSWSSGDGEAPARKFSRTWISDKDQALLGSSSGTVHQGIRRFFLYTSQTQHNGRLSQPSANILCTAQFRRQATVALFLG